MDRGARHEPGRGLEGQELGNNSTDKANATLYESLEAKRIKEDEEFREASKLKNFMRGLDNREAEYIRGLQEESKQIDRAQARDMNARLSEFRK